MSFKVLVLLSRRDDMTPEEFRTWWLGEHSALAAQLPGVRRIVFNLGTDADQVASADVDGVAELWFDDEASFVAAYATEIGQRVTADSLAHLRSRVRLFVSEHVMVDGEAS